MLGMRRLRVQLLLGIATWGNLMGTLTVSSDVRRHGRFGVGDAVGWFLFVIIGGTLWGWMMSFATRQQSPIHDEPQPVRDSVRHALKTGKLDDDPRMRSLELAVAARNYRRPAEIVAIAFIFAILLGVLLWWAGPLRIHYAPWGYWVLLGVSAALLVSVLCVALVTIVRRNPALERILAEGHRANQIDAA